MYEEINVKKELRRHSGCLLLIVVTVFITLDSPLTFCLPVSVKS